MKKRILIISVTVFLLMMTGIFLNIAFFSGSEAHTAEITLDGEIIRTIDLRTAQDETFTVEGDHGWNIIKIDNGEISVTEASCPDKVCVKHGALKSEMLPIVCLPNKLVISLK